ncbi:UDP-N-acetylmuramate dehydrogenase [Candidatus Gottesmanbacteria bacterium]|nr:UDP-N-acetylmuramate dehydrogenase [Candidatus Gottesmanbacteria bacterium]
MKSTIEELKEVLGDRLHINVPLAPYTTLKIGGLADAWCEVHSVDDLVEVATAARIRNIPVTLLGGGSNVLISDKGIRGLVIKNNTESISMRGARGKLSAGKSERLVYVEADSGVVMNKLVRFTCDEGLAGLEMHLGLPGTVGGALYMNSKWMRPEGYVGDVVYQAEILDEKNIRRIVPNSYFQFGYDYSSIQKTHDIVLRVVFVLAQSDVKHLWQIANASIAYRRQTQPQGVRSPGCTFRNISAAQALISSLPEGSTSAGFLLDHAGVKKYCVRDAEISNVHANFIVNKGKATADDVVQLINRAKEQVKRQFGVTLEEEIVRLGEFS